jgi:SseB protein N-terminal domain
MTDTDSAGIPWTGRYLSGTGYDDDEGGADPELADALAEAHDRPSAEADGRLARAAAVARWLVPVVAVRGDDEVGGESPSDEPHLSDSDPSDSDPSDSYSGDAHAGDTRTDMAIITLVAPDGRRALPLFTSVEALAAWDPAARPVPVSAARAAQAALADGCQVAVVDLGSGRSTELRPSMLWALAQDLEWTPPHFDPVVAQAVSEAVANEPDVITHQLEEGEPLGCGVLRVVLGIRAGLSEELVEALATRIGEELSIDEDFRARVDELTLSVASVRR